MVEHNVSSLMEATLRKNLLKQVFLKDRSSRAIALLSIPPLRSPHKEFLASYHIYADDITIYLEFDLGTTFANFLKHNKIIASVLKLIAALKLKVNSSKTQCKFVTNQKTRLPETITIDGIRIEIKDRVKVLGVTLDKKLSFSSFINSTCAKSYYHLRKIRSIRNFLSFDVTKLLILTFVISRLDYCNSLLYGAPDYMIKKFQRDHNRAACLLPYQGNSNVILLLNELHWLPVETRIRYKIL